MTRLQTDNFHVPAESLLVLPRLAGILTKQEKVERSGGLHLFRRLGHFVGFVVAAELTQSVGFQDECNLRRDAGCLGPLDPRERSRIRFGRLFR